MPGPGIPITTFGQPDNGDFENKKSPKKPEFALDAWDYTPEALAKFIEKLSKGDSKIKAELETALRESGGKAFGLKVCEMVADNFQSSEYKLKVPSWKMLKSIDDLADEYDSLGSIMRSSEQKEDWLDPRSGTAKTFKFRIMGSEDWDLFNDELIQNPPDKYHWIQQEIINGYGLVVDIAHSKINNGKIVKITAGNYAKRGFTSATYDTCASVGAWDANKGEPIIATHSFFPSLQRKTFFSEEGGINDNPFAKELAEALEKTGIDFGIQLEIIRTELDENTFHLVQTRPSPSKILNIIPIENKLDNIENYEQQLIIKGGLTNGTFNFIGNPVVFDTLDDKEKLAKIQKDGNELAEVQDLEAEILPENSVNIAITTKQTDLKELLYYARDETPRFYLGLARNGQKVIITRSPIRSTEHHDGSKAPDEDTRIYDFLDKHCGTISLQLGEVQKLEYILESHKGPIRVASDGLLDGIYLLTEKK